MNDWGGYRFWGGGCDGVRLLRNDLEVCETVSRSINCIVQ